MPGARAARGRVAIPAGTVRAAGRARGRNAGCSSRGAGGLMRRLLALLFAAAVVVDVVVLGGVAWLVFGCGLYSGW